VPEEPQPTDWAYAAGLVDGEGCIAVTRSFSRTSNRYIYGVAVVVVNRDREVLEWMHRLWSGWVVAMLKPHSGRWTCKCGLGLAFNWSGVGAISQGHSAVAPHQGQAM
jgi:hypothetical protein